ncbi:hypothetical protein DFH07DRAFT_513880 [Mycena maculata]|uniref:Uncharacterized protein n=1 Tax=Mycena maculata TaxID=230809 RepID=A0AAD7NB48_9AGAR|nr:hypothetical protein DFH07DRAFT_513880 [Mycena maculata]
MPAIKARDSSESTNSSVPNVGLIVAIAVGAVVLILVFVALLISILKQRRAERLATFVPSTVDDFMSKAERERVLEKSYQAHRNSDSMGPLLEDAPNWAQGGRQPRVHLSDLPTLPDNVGASYEEEDQDLGPHIRTGPITYSHPPPGLRLTIPKSAPIPTSKWLYKPRTEKEPSPSSPDSSESEYSQRSASTNRMHTIDLASPPPPVPALPEHLRPRTSLPPEEPPLVRGDTILVAGLLKSRAKHMLERSVTRTSRIERADSIAEAPSPRGEREKRPRRARGSRPPPLPMETLSVDADESFAEPLDAETLGYYASQPLESPLSPDETSSLSSNDTIMPRPFRSTKSAM